MGRNYTIRTGAREPFPSVPLRRTCRGEPAGRARRHGLRPRARSPRPPQRRSRHRPTFRRCSGPTGPRRLPGSPGGRRAALPRPARTGSRARPRGSGTALHAVQPPALRVRGEELTTKLRRAQAAKRADGRLERLVSLQLFAPDASVRGARPCAQIHPPTLSMPHTYAGCRYHAWQRTPAHAPAFLQRLDHCASSSSISSSGEHSTGQIRPELGTTLTTIVRVLALLICLKFQVIR